MLAGLGAAALNCAFLCQAALAFEKEFFTLAAAKPANGSNMSSHFRNSKLKMSKGSIGRHIFHS
jgi:hypothetical protein